METYFTSDHHFCHSNVIRMCDRPFSNIEEMNEILIERWNSVVKKNDVVYYLGDFFYKESARKSKEILYRLNGRICLIKGNHERGALRYPERFESINDFLIINDFENNYKKITLCHYPLISWHGSYRNFLHFYGHSHGKTNHSNLNAIDVGVDCWDFYPISYETIKQNIKNKTTQKEFHWTDKKIIDFVNWYVKLHNLDIRYNLENQTILDSFKNGDNINKWKHIH